MGVTDIPAVIAAELARLRAENARLLRLLKITRQQAAPPGPAQAAYFEAPPGMVDDGSPPDAKVAFYAALFAARTDVYATRFDNPRTGKGGWIPAVLDSARGYRLADKHRHAAHGDAQDRDLVTAGVDSQQVPAVPGCLDRALRA